MITEGFFPFCPEMSCPALNSIKGGHYLYRALEKNKGEVTGEQGKFIPRLRVI